jgi:hypothetical protein
MTELLSNLDLEYYCKLLNIPLFSVLSKDLFNDFKPKKGNYIINLNDSDEAGSHWTCLKLLNEEAIYYDSFGLPMPDDILMFIKRYDKKIPIIYSTDQIQHFDSIYCGFFVLFWLYFFHTHKCRHFKYLINKHNALFNLKNKNINDKIIQNLIIEIFKEQKNIL